MENLTALMISVIYVFAALIVVVFFDNFANKSPELSRKMLHILTGNWILISLRFTDIWWLLLLPFGLLLLNALSLKFNLVKAMERDDDSWGTVFYPLSIMVLCAIDFIMEMPIVGVVGIMVLAYGDGLAALVGKRWGKRHPFKLAPQKSLAGTMTVVVAGFVICWVALKYFNYDFDAPLAIIIALNTGFLAALLELVGKKGSDNLTLPLGDRPVCGCQRELSWHNVAACHPGCSGNLGGRSPQKIKKRQKKALELSGVLFYFDFFDIFENQFRLAIFSGLGIEIDEIQILIQGQFDGAAVIEDQLAAGHFVDRSGNVDDLVIGSETKIKKKCFDFALGLIVAFHDFLGDFKRFDFLKVFNGVDDFLLDEHSRIPREDVELAVNFFDRLGKE